MGYIYTSGGGVVVLRTPQAKKVEIEKNSLPRGEF